MLKFFNSGKNKKLISAIIIIVLILALVIPLASSALSF
jgi:hypothetical protein